MNVADFRRQGATAWLIILVSAILAIPTLGEMVDAREPDAVFTIVAPQQAVALRIQVEIDGQPLPDILRPRFASLFAHLDRDGSQRLDADELQSAPSAGWLRRLAWGYLPANHSEPVTLAKSDLNQDGWTSLAELQSWYACHGIGTITAVTSRSSSTPMLTAALWNRLDADRDSRLSFIELRAAPELLRKLDEDDDELVSGREVASSVIQVYPFGTSRSKEPYFEIAAGRDAPKVDYPVLVRLSLQGFQAEVVNIPGNAALAEPPKQPAASEASLRASLLPGGISFRLGGCPCSMLGAQSSPGRWRQSVELTAKTHFAAADTNHDQAVTADEAAAATNRSVLALFSYADPNRDHRVTLEEWQAALGVLIPLAEAGVQFTVLSHEHSLFELLDENRDGYLSRPELRAASTILRDARRDQLPTSATIFFSLGSPTGPAARFEGQVPAWFAAMDRNHDGTVTRAEFPGTRDAFDRLDKNRDGQVANQEAGHKPGGESPMPR